MASKKKSKKLGLADYKKLLSISRSVKPADMELIDKLHKKIDQLENPPVREKKEKAQYECKSCNKKFKRVPIICPECESDDHIVKLDEWA